MKTITFGRGPLFAALALMLGLALAAPVAQGAAGKHDGRAAKDGKSQSRDGVKGKRSKSKSCKAKRKKGKPCKSKPRSKGSGATCVAGGDPANPDKTIEALRSNDYNLAQFDDVFRCLGKYDTPMPGWDVEAKGWVRLAPDAGPGDKAAMQALMNVWQGKHWYTRPDGGYIYNRMFDNRETWYHRVTSTSTTLVDDRPAIFVDASPVPGVDNIRMVQPGVYLGITQTDGVKPIWGPDSTTTVPRGLAHGYFILDFDKIEMSRDECPLCTPTDHEGP